jgi:hypothetical protein
MTNNIKLSAYRVLLRWNFRQSKLATLKYLVNVGVKKRGFPFAIS